MAFPAIQKYTAAGMLLNQTIAFVSLLATMGSYIVGIANQAIAKGYTVAGSSNGVAAAMDGVNRCTLAAGFAVRATIAGAAQSWLVITAANGAQTLFAYQGASDDIARISCSPGGLFIVAGTATFQPTATDEVVGTSGATLIGATASANRVFNVIIDSAHNGWRAWIYRLNVVVGSLIWCELFDAAFISGTASIAVPVWCGAMTAVNAASLSSAGGVYAANSAGGSCRGIVSGTPTTINLGGTFKIISNGINENGILQELNGNSFVNRAIGVGSNTATAHGDVGNRFDWHFGQDLRSAGDLDASKFWTMLNNQSTAGVSGGVLWPWDGVSAVVTA